jgi:uncharacterized cupin superfamily protein
VEQRVHEGYEWLYVISGQLRLVLGDKDFTLTAGEAAEFDTRIPHAVSNGGPNPLELLNISSTANGCTCALAALSRRYPPPASDRDAIMSRQFSSLPSAPWTSAGPLPDPHRSPPPCRIAFLELYLDIRMLASP